MKFGSLAKLTYFNDSIVNYLQFQGSANPTHSLFLKGLQASIGPCIFINYCKKNPNETKIQRIWSEYSLQNLKQLLPGPL